MTSPLRYRPYRWLVTGTTVNALGNAVAPVALAFAVLDLGGDVTGLGLVVGLYALAEVTAVLAGGVLGDRWSRTLLVQGSCAAAAAVQALVALALIGGWASIALLAVAGAATGALGALGNPSSNALTQQSVPAAVLAPAITGRRLGQNVAQIVGTGLAGLLVASIGSGWAYAVDAVTFVVCAGSLALVRVPRSTGSTPGAGVLSEAVAGLREVMRHTWLWLLIGQALLYHLFYGGAQGVLGPVVVGDAFGRAAWGWALSVMMTGFVVGGLVTLRWRPRRALYAGTLLLALTAAFPLAMAWASASGAGLWWVLVGAFLHGFGLEIFSVGWDLSIQQNVPTDRLSRVYSFDMVGSFVARPVGIALTGPVAAATGLEAWLAVVGAVILASVAAAVTSPAVRRLERRAPARVAPVPAG